MSKPDSDTAFAAELSSAADEFGQLQAGHHKAAPLTLGDLRLWRQRLGVSPHSMARALGISMRQFESLESGNWQALPGSSFVRPVLFAYGRRLGLHDREALEQLLPATMRHQVADLHSDIDDRRIKPKGLLGFAHGGSGSVFAWLCLIFAFLAALIHYFGRSSA